MKNFKQKLRYLTKLKPFNHQYTHFLKHRDAKFWAFLWDMGTGKTKIIFDVTVHLFLNKKIDCLVLVAPNGVHKKHLTKAAPEHIHTSITYETFIYESKKIKIKKNKHLLNSFLLKNENLKIISINPDALITKQGFDVILQVLVKFNCYMVVDEFTDFKTPTSKRAKQLLKLSNYPLYKAILDGTPIQKSPMDIWVGFNFLQHGCLGHTFYMSFKNEYCKLDNFKLRNDIYKILKQSNFYKKGNLSIKESCVISDITDSIFEHMKGERLSNNNLSNLLPCDLWDCKTRLLSLARKAYFTETSYKNLDKLNNIIYKFSSRYLKNECLDLPKSTTIDIPYYLDDKTNQLYQKLKKDLIAEYNTVTMSTPYKLTLLLRFQQLLGGFFKPDFEQDQIEISTQRVDLLLNQLSKIASDHKVLIFCKFTSEIKQIIKKLKLEYGTESTVDYYGETKAKDRESNLTEFIQNPNCKYFVANRKSGGVGLDGLQVASYVINYSNEASSRYQLQAVDRAIRSGQKNKVTILNIYALETYDERLRDILMGNKILADEITGDKFLDLV